MKLRLLLITATIAVALAAAIVVAQARPRPVKRAAPSIGKIIFERTCSACHAKNGSKPARWKSVVQKMSLAQVEERVRTGGKGMPSFAKKFSKPQIVDVARYAKSLAGCKR